MAIFKLLKNLNVFSPQSLGKRDILIYGTQIVKMAQDIETPFPDETEVADYSGFYCFPGFVDGHVHIIGGGGEGGFFTRTTPQSEQDFFMSGTTAVIGVLGTDGIMRTHRELLGQARKFSHNKLKTYLMTGNYALPLVTLLKTLQEDIMFIPEYIGIGEIAISDHRGSGITLEEFRRILALSKRIVFLGGAGTSTESGIPDFRSNDGVYAALRDYGYPPETGWNCFGKRYPSAIFHPIKCFPPIFQEPPKH